MIQQSRSFPPPPPSSAHPISAIVAYFSQMTHLFCLPSNSTSAERRFARQPCFCLPFCLHKLFPNILHSTADQHRSYRTTKNRHRKKECVMRSYSFAGSKEKEIASKSHRDTTVASQGPDHRRWQEYQNHQRRHYRQRRQGFISKEEREK